LVRASAPDGDRCSLDLLPAGAGNAIPLWWLARLDNNIGVRIMNAASGN
jgi:hypothetical protein